MIALTADRQCWVHAATSRSALAGIRKKMRVARVDAELSGIADLPNKQFVDRMVPYGDIIVRLSDARAVRACDAGIRDWCDASGIPYADGKAKLATVMEAYRRRPEPEARAAMLHAVRRFRSAKRAT